MCVHRRRVVVVLRALACECRIKVADVGGGFLQKRTIHNSLYVGGNHNAIGSDQTDEKQQMHWLFSIVVFFSKYVSYVFCFLLLLTTGGMNGGGICFCSSLSQLPFYVLTIFLLFLFFRCYNYFCLPRAE